MRDVYGTQDARGAAGGRRLEKKRNRTVVVVICMGFERRLCPIMNANQDAGSINYLFLCESANAAGPQFNGFVDTAASTPHKMMSASSKMMKV